MELGPIFRALLHNKARFWLITLEVALSVAIVVNCIAIISDLQARLTEPTGMDEDNIIAIRTEPFGADFETQSFVEIVQEEDLRRLRAHPGVREATTIDRIPLSGSGRTSGRRPVGSKAEQIMVPNIMVGDRALQTLGVELIQGRDFIPQDFDYSQRNKESRSSNRNIIISQDLAQTLFPMGDALGKTIGDDETTETIVGVIRLMHNAWPRSSFGKRITLWPERYGNSHAMRYLVRAEPGMVDVLYTVWTGQAVEGAF